MHVDHHTDCSMSFFLDPDTLHDSLGDNDPVLMDNGHSVVGMDVTSADPFPTIGVHCKTSWQLDWSTKYEILLSESKQFIFFGSKNL